jgi:hypothetical protein
MSLADRFHDDLRESLDHLGRPRNRRGPGEQPSQATQIILHAFPAITGNSAR